MIESRRCSRLGPTSPFYTDLSLPDNRITFCPNNVGQLMDGLTPAYTHLQRSERPFGCRIGLIWGYNIFHGRHSRRHSW